MSWLPTIFLAWIGLLFGSLAAAQVWRLRARQLQVDDANGEKIDHHELKRLRILIRPAGKDRSECLQCHTQLAWYDLVPIVSWVSLGGKCRYCRKPIGVFEPFMEIGLAVVFVVSYLLWGVPLDTMLSSLQFGVWLIACVLMAMLFAYDVKWFLLPFGLNLAVIGLSVIFAILQFVITGFTVEKLISLIIGVGLLGGLYLLFSLRGWSGMGDGILGIGLALVVGSWQHAFLTLFLANVLGCLFLVPLAWQRKLHPGTHIPFGPFLISATFITLLWGDSLIALALTVTGML